MDALLETWTVHNMPYIEKDCLDDERKITVYIWHAQAILQEHYLWLGGAVCDSQAQR